MIKLLAAIAALAAAATSRASATGLPCHIRVRAGELDGLRAAADRLAAGKFDVPSSGDVRVCLEAGVHRLTSTVELTSAHNHPRGAPGRVLWTAEGASGSAVVTGGVPLTDWWHCDDGTHCPGQDWHLVYAHATAGLPNVTASNLPFRQLWVGGERATRVAQDPSSFGLTPTATGFSATALPSSASGWPRAQAEMRWPSQIRNWIEPRCVVTGVTATTVTMDPECWSNLTSRNHDKTPPVPDWIENVGGPPAPGEFLSDPDYIFFRPGPGAPYGPPADAWAPVLATLVVADGVTGHVIEGLTFSHATWRAPSEPGGYVPTQTIVSTKGEPTGSVRVLGSRDVTVRNCTFRNLGTGYALEVGNATQGAAITGSVFGDLSGGAVKLGNVLGGRELSNDTSLWDADYAMSDCTIEEAAVEFRGGAAVFAGYLANYSADHNTIRGTGYTGFSTGWGWGTHVHGQQTYARDNRLTNNAVIDPMSALNDGGCFYTLGPSPGSVSEGNYCDGDRAPVVGGIYRDNGSRFWNVTRNVVGTTPAPCVYLQGCCDSPAYNISVSDLWCRSTAPIRNECRPQGCHVDNSTVTYVKADAPWPAAAQAIIDAAGARL